MEVLNDKKDGVPRRSGGNEGQKQRMYESSNF